MVTDFSLTRLMLHSVADEEAGGSEPGTGLAAGDLHRAARL